MHPSVLSLQASFQQNAHAANAVQMQAYMKDHFPFHGIKSPLRKQLQKSFIAAAVGPDKIVPRRVIEDLWQLPQREYQYVAMDLLEKFARKGPAEYIDWYADLVTRKSWWDTVDLLCNSVWKHFLSHPEQRIPYTQQWISSDNMWLQRTALIFQRKAKLDTDWEMLQDYILLVCESKAFFIRKAIGWALREFSKHRPDLVRDFLARHGERLSPLSIREASKYL
ncbi:MAG: DNA alkylation repair protein [Bacteroidota bacterium]